MMQKKSWGELSPVQQASIIVSGVVQLSLLAAALWDLAHRSPEEVRGDRRMWAGLAFINWIGPLAYFGFGRRWESCPFARTPDTVAEDD